MLATATVNCSFTERSPSPIKATDDSMQFSTQQIGGTSLLMHSSFGVHRCHSDDVTNASFTTTTFRPRRSISSSAGQQQTRHVVCMLNNYSHSFPSNQQQITSDDDEHNQPNHNLTQGQGEDSFDDNDDDDDIANELNLAVVVVGNEDVQSLKGFTTEQTNNENGSLNVAFIDETDLERNLINNKPIYENDQAISQSDVQLLNIENNENETLLQTIVAERNSIEIKDNTNQQSTQSNGPVLVEKPLNKDDDLDEILRQNENRCIRLTDSDVS
jgi:hypothetical protein